MKKYLLIILLFFFVAFSAQNFIKVSENHFIRDSKPYYFIGTNYWYGGMLGAKNGDFNPLLIINPSSLNSQFFTVKLKIARLLPDTKLAENITKQFIIGKLT